MKKIPFCLIIIVLYFSNLSFADDINNLFPKTLNSAKELSAQLSYISKNENTNYNDVALFAQRLKQNAIDETKGLQKECPYLKEDIEKFCDSILVGSPFQRFILISSSRVYSIGRISNYRVLPVDAECQKLSAYNNKDCVEIFRDLSVALNTSFEKVLSDDIDAVYQKLGLYSQQWERYFDKARSQTSVELIVNTFFYRHELRKNEFVPPPICQGIILHPSVIIEYIPDADDGDKQKEALSIEIVGVNWWDSKIPFGFSTVITCSDRSSVADMGYGLMFHFFNNYSLGATLHKRDPGIFLNVDLLKMFENKKDNLQKYIDKVKKIRTN